MVSELGRTALTIGVVALVAIAGAWAWTLNEPIVHEADSPPAPVHARVIFPEGETRMETATLPIPPNGPMVFEPLDVPLTNVTFVTVTLHIRVDGLVGRETILIHVEDPIGNGHDGETNGPSNPNASGFTGSRAVITDWRHAIKPNDAVYTTTDTRSAEAWAAANHTYRDSVGGWKATVEVTPGELLPGIRNGTVSLSFLFRHYVGTAVLEDPRPAEERVPEGPPSPNGTEGEAAVRSATQSAATLGEGVAGVGNEDASRTFFTGTRPGLLR